MGFFFATLILLLVLAAATWMGRRWGHASGGRRPGRRHWITRAVCATLGGAIVVALAVCTIRDARGSSDPGLPVDLRLPTQPPPEFPPKGGPIPKGRFLLHAVIISVVEGAFVPIYGKTYEVQWPRDRRMLFEETLDVRGATVTYHLSLHGIGRRDFSSGPEFYYEGERRVSASGMDSYSSTSEGLQLPEATRIMRSEGHPNWFSIGGLFLEGAALLTDVTPVRDDDPLRAGGVDELLALRGDRRWRAEVNFAIPRERFWGPSGSPAEDLLNALGPATLPILAAAILFAQLFRRRSLGFVKMVACLLLFVGALDRTALRIRESRVKDPGAPLDQRLAACGRLPATAFFRKTALRNLEAAAVDPGSPDALRDLAEGLAERAKRYHFP